MLFDMISCGTRSEMVSPGSDGSTVVVTPPGGIRDSIERRRRPGEEGPRIILGLIVVIFMFEVWCRGIVGYRVAPCDPCCVFLLCWACVVVHAFSSCSEKVRGSGLVCVFVCARACVCVFLCVVCFFLWTSVVTFGLVAS